MQTTSYMEFASKVKGKKWTRAHIRRKFVKQVDKDDYAKAEIGQIVDYLYKLSLA